MWEGTAQIKALRKVAGRLRLDLAQYRELEAFAKFGSDLDKATQQQLRRGARLVELLKQDQYVPMAVEKQIVGMFAGTNGYLDPVPLEDVQRFEKELLEHIEMKYPDMYTTISGTKDLSEQTTTKLHEILREFSGKFRAAGKTN